ncbi:MAG: DUF5916 domain-containing protein [Pseudomonadales bacterium]
MRCLWLLVVFAAGNLCAQSPAEVPDSRTLELNVGEAISMPRVPDSELGIRIDGDLDDAAWSQAAVVTDFRVIDPDTMAEPRYPTKLMLIYSERGIYAGYDAVQPPETVVLVLSPEDTGTRFGDFVGLVLDTSGDGKYGYWVSLSSSGVKTDGTLIAEAQFNSDWDGVWYGETSMTDHGWSAEIFVPWSQLAMPKQTGARKMSVFASRRVAAIGERWGVPALPLTINQFIQHMRPMQLVDVDPRQQWSVIPYSSVTYDQMNDKTELRAGAELFWRPSTNFQVSGSILPDFGNVESDNVVINLSALETFFPEKRLFFLEGRDIFFTTPRSDSARNFFPVTIVNTRRIGGTPRGPDVPDGVTVPSIELNQQVELYGAVKATGQVGSVRYGLLGASEDDVTFDVDGEKYRQSGSDYAVARLLWEDSSSGGYRALGAISTLTAHPDEDAVVLGIDYHYQTPSGVWKLDGQFLHSDKDSVGLGWGGLADLVYNPRRGLKFDLGLEHYDDKLDINDLGFLPRNDITRGTARVNYTDSDVSWARQLTLGLFSIYVVNGDGDVTGQGVSGSAGMLLNNLDRVDTSLLFFARRTDDLESFGNGSFRVPDRWEFHSDYFSDFSRPFSYRIGLDVNQEKIDGVAIKARIGVEWRPSSRLKINLLTEYVRRDAWLLHQEEGNFTTFDTREWRPTLSVDFFFNARQQLRLSAQWVGIQAREQMFFKVPDDAGHLDEVTKAPGGASDDFTISNLNVQLRYRWELAPLSDLFLVYTLGGLKTPARASFSDLLRTAYEDPVSEKIVLKLRYRFGS